MQHLPSEDQSSQASNRQRLDVSKSDLTNSPIGQAEGNVNQANRDINYFINSIQSDSSEDLIDKIRKFEESLQLELKEKLDKAALLVNDLRACIEDQLTDGRPKEGSTILRLLDELQSILGKQSSLELISEDLEFCQEGGIWLQKNQRRLARLAKNHIFSSNGSSFLLREASSNLSFHELESRFVEDLETYIAWISIYLKIGAKPKSRDFQDGIFRVHLDLPESAYKNAFELLNIDFIDPSVSRLSSGAANCTAAYFNGFIVDRDLSQDSKISLKKKLFKIVDFSKFPLKKGILFSLVVAVISIILMLK